MTKVADRAGLSSLFDVGRWIRVLPEEPFLFYSHFPPEPAHTVKPVRKFEGRSQIFPQTIYVAPFYTHLLLSPLWEKLHARIGSLSRNTRAQRYRVQSLNDVQL
jgi:hypothetical protein